MCDCVVLNAEEMSANRSLAVVFGVSRCLWMVSVTCHAQAVYIVPDGKHL